MSRFLDELMQFINEKQYNVIRVSQVCGDGEIETAERREDCICRNTYSVSKTFTMTAIGLLVDRGLLRVDEKVCDILKDELPESGMDERWHISTVETALKHRLGLPGGFLDIDVTRSQEFTRDFLRYMLTYPLQYEPETGERYSDGAYYLLSRIAEKRAGMPIDDFLWKELLWDMDYRELAWSRCPMGHPMGATGLYINSADMVKLGQLYLSGGMYHGKRLLSEEWTKQAMEKGYAIDCDRQRKVFHKGGMYGQLLLMVPEQNRAIAVQSFGADGGEICKWVGEYC